MIYDFRFAFFSGSSVSNLNNFNHRYLKNSGSATDMELNGGAGSRDGGRGGAGSRDGGGRGGGARGDCAFSPQHSKCSRSFSASTCNVAEDRPSMNLKPKRLKFCKVAILQKGMISLTGKFFYCFSLILFLKTI